MDEIAILEAKINDLRRTIDLQLETIQVLVEENARVLKQLKKERNKLKKEREAKNETSNN